MTKLFPGRAWHARTVVIDDPGALDRYLSDAADVAWLRQGDGVVGLGVADQVSVGDPAGAQAWWSEFSESIEHETELVGEWGVGPLAFASFAFDPAAPGARSVAIAPRVIIGRRGDLCWATTLAPADSAPPPLPRPAPAPSAPGAISYPPDQAERAAWLERVARAVEQLAQGEALDKVVLARAVAARAAEPVDPRWLVGRLASSYPSCWTYHVDGLVGASPELLVRSRGGLALSRVLAGTVERHHEEADDLLAVALTESAKDVVEHEIAVKSVADALAPVSSGINVPEQPFVLRLPNVMHLASDITAATLPGVTALDLIGRLHPSAAVCGTPRDAARATISELEGLDRGRYAGPVGWVDTNGEGEWAIALRCGQIGADPHDITLFAGCGIVAGSVPERELSETDAKLQPMREALGDA
ncbi:isochorismate synthase [Nigerium sp.]|uniref:isochorismate synthase n=1 Tax=Nigerium sp. TaxID=2042655 RepID=UPI0032213E28